ncbi:hypothetical protein GCM10010492_75430 [Saccharothrix mutabilis subsp. mutabilis]|uniref:OmpA-like domain-containing protein n=1 Tax=Saccharothrix mutabilis subsp. mutabilis TaxID=66855 RepID=A0ABP3EKM4_9PSEU
MARRPVLPLAVAAVVVPAAVTAFGFTVYGEEITGALPFSSSPAQPSHLVKPPTRLPVPTRPTTEPAEVVAPPPSPPSPELARQNVASLFSSNGVKGITFAPGTTDHVGRGEAVQTGVGNLLGGVPGAVVTLVAHAWNGETLSHRCDVLAMRRAALVRDFLVARGVPAEAISTRVVVDPVWGPPSDGGPQVDVLVG